MIDALKRLQAHTERETLKLQTEIEIRFDKIMRDQLDNWSRRFPRHTFAGLYAMGLLSFEVSPKVCGENMVEYLDRRPGAIGQLGKEARAFIDQWTSMESKVSPIPLTAWVRLEKDAGTL